MKTVNVCLVALTLFFVAGCGNKAASPKPTATPIPPVSPTLVASPTAAATSAGASTPVASQTPSSTATAGPTTTASPTTTAIITNIPTWCGNLGSAQSEINKLNAQLGGNPSVSDLLSTLNQLHDLIAADAAKATGKTRTYFNELAAGAKSLATNAGQYSGILSSEIKAILKAEVDGIGIDWQAVKEYAGCGSILKP